MHGPSAIEVVEVSPRDGLQNEAAMVGTQAKLDLIARAITAGARRIEAVSFVHPERVPQMADAEAVMAGVTRRLDVTYAGLVLNPRGLERAISARVDEVNVVVVASDAFSLHNQGTTTEGGVRAFAAMSSTCEVAGIRCTAAIAAAFGCPISGDLPPERVAAIAGALHAAGAAEIALADTIGVAVPTDLERLLPMVRAVTGAVPLRLHLHDTRRTALGNAYAGWRAGVAVFDGSIGGIGGCPFAPRATGNVATEDLAWMFARMGVRTGLDLPALIDTALELEALLGHPVSSALSRVGIFPR